jgi:hypothetical protein
MPVRSSEFFFVPFPLSNSRVDVLAISIFLFGRCEFSISTVGGSNLTENIPMALNYNGIKIFESSIN